MANVLFMVACRRAASVRVWNGDFVVDLLFHENQIKMMRKEIYFSIVFGIASHEHLIFLKKVHVQESYEFHSRILRVAEGSPKKKESKSNEILSETLPKIGSDKKKVH